MPTSASVSHRRRVGSAGPRGSSPAYGGGALAPSERSFGNVIRGHPPMVVGRIAAMLVKEGGARCGFMSHGPERVERRQRRLQELNVPELWASLAIIVMWLAVLFDAIFGPGHR